MPEKFEQVDAFSMLCMIDHIVTEDAVRNGIHEDAYSIVRTKIKESYKSIPAVTGSDGKALPPEKSVAPTYLVPDANGHYPGLLPPSGG